ncbi:MAG: SMP-30/gluconolactonase/LRE family protein [Candidatus Acidiferrales bacterium]
MKTYLRGWLLGLALMAAAVAASAPPQEIEMLDPALDKIVPADAKLERVATGFYKWTEGPVWTRDGSLFFAEIPANNIDRWIPGRGASVFLHPSGYTGTEPYKGPEPGSNGMTLDAMGRLTVAGHARRNVWRFESLDPKAQITVLADSYQGKKLNSPNDLVYKSDGSLYFTDPPYGLPTQADNDPEKELKVNGVYRIPNASRQKPGAPPDRDKLQLVIGDVGRPNGIAFSPDEKYLYIAESGVKEWLRYRVLPDGSVTDGIVFLDASKAPGVGGPDGIKVDKEGNLYGSGPGGVWIISPEGKHLGTILVPERMANLNWGDDDAKTLYITASTSVYRIRLKITGVRP